jgi:ABC-type phosphate/phosphonate transport system substrate-binding protein
MIAALPMYDLPHVMAANDRLWARIRDGLRKAGQPAPDMLTRGVDNLLVQWQSPDLLLSQTCGMPYRTRLHGKVTLIGTPDYGLRGCPPGQYRSVFVAHKDDPRQSLPDFDGAHIAYNEPVSQSGWAAPQNHAATHGLTLRPALRTGGHRLSLQAVAEGRAPLAALDALTWELLCDHDPATKGVKVVGHTDPTPGLPYIAAIGANQPLLFDVIADAIAALSDDDRAVTRLRGLVAIPAQAYLAVPTPVAA